MAVLTYFGAQFAVIRRVSPEGSPYEAMHSWVLTYFGAQFAVIRRVSPEGSPYEAMHSWGEWGPGGRCRGGASGAQAAGEEPWAGALHAGDPWPGHPNPHLPARPAFFAGVSLAGLLALGAVLSAAATVREAGGLMAGGFLCFALVFCVLVQVAFWRLHNPTQVEDAMLDTYDLVYDRALRSPSSARRQELVAVQDTFLCCGKTSPSSLLGSVEADLCRGEAAATQDCLQGIRRFLRTHGHIASILTSACLASMVYAMLLSSFLWFTIRSGRSLDRKGTYALSPRARGCRPQEPSFFRRTQGSPALHHLDDLLGSGGHSGGPRLLQDN
ncbi:PREDICTED: tetraspanin-32 [Miniopterus natalensis]|uniref:tetraspanin-32 n=1 Tax=Miniopterus natalensis TaxID=291302 RepID=UPI0007A72F85|nr:PREDICTED: tetraspanin-32 [Miniopterus natalensis]